MKLPPKVHYKHGSYYYVTRHAGKRKWIRLGKTEPEMYRKLAAVMDGEFKLDTMGEFFDRYKKEELPTKAERTQKDYERALHKLIKAFGHMRCDQVTTQHVMQYKYARGKTSQVQANREMAVLSGVFSVMIDPWGILTVNPCKGVKYFPEHSRTRSVTDAEYQAVYKLASPLIQIAMEIAVITGMRQGDILNLRREQVKEDGLHLTQAKTGKRQIFELTPALSDALEAAKKLRKVKSATHLICNRSGQPYTSSGFKSIWQRTMNKAMEDKVIGERFTFHDLRSKAADDSTDATRLLGHDDPKTTNKIYKRKPTVVKPNR